MLVDYCCMILNVATGTREHQHKKISCEGDKKKKILFNPYIVLNDVQTSDLSKKGKIIVWNVQRANELSKAQNGKVVF